MARIKPITERILFGLESMRDKCQYYITCEELSSEQEEKYDALREECEQLLYKARRGYTSKDYDRMVEITHDREYMRFNACIANGMSYEMAAPEVHG